MLSHFNPTVPYGTFGGGHGASWLSAVGAGGELEGLLGLRV